MSYFNSNYLFDKKGCLPHDGGRLEGARAFSSHIFILHGRKNTKVWWFQR